MSRITNFPYKALTPQQKAFYQKRLGRELTAREELMGQLMRTPNPQFGEPWHLRTIGPHESALDRQLREARQAVEDERVANMSDAGRRLHAMEKAAEERNAKAAAQAAHAAKLQAFKKQLEHLDWLLEAARFDESYTYEDIADLFNTKQQIESEQGCPVYAAEMFDFCVTKAKAKIEVRRQEALAAKNHLLAEQAKQEAALAHFQEQWGFLAPPEDDSAPTVSDADKVFNFQLDSLRKSMLAKYDTFNGIAKDAPPDVREAARAEWSSALKVLTNHKVTRPDLCPLSETEKSYLARQSATAAPAVPASTGDE